MSRKRGVRWGRIVLNDLDINYATYPAQCRRRRTVLNAVSVAIHRAFAPVILNSENWSARRRMAGWMSPLTALTVFGLPKCENMRSPRSLAPAASYVLIVARPVSFAFPGVAGAARGVVSVALNGFFAAGDEVDGWPVVFPAALAAR